MPLNRAVQGSRSSKERRTDAVLERGCLSRDPDGFGRPRHWILEFHLLNRAGPFGSFYEQLLKTIRR